MGNETLEQRDKGCQYCREENCRIKHSYDDVDVMTAIIHSSKPNKYGFKSPAWWMTVNFREEKRDFYIEFCPFCGKRLVPYREELSEDCGQGG